MLIKNNNNKVKQTKCRQTNIQTDNGGKKNQTKKARKYLRRFDIVKGQETRRRDIYANVRNKTKHLNQCQIHTYYIGL